MNKEIKEKDLTNEINYPGVSDRIKAAVTDSFIMIGFMFIAAYSFSQFEDLPDKVRAITFIFIFGLYDPNFTSLFGGTLGHMAMNLRVRRKDNNEKNINFFKAIIRFIVKLILGIISLLTVGTNKKHLAIHDQMAGSIVVYRKK